MDTPSEPVFVPDDPAPAQIRGNGTPENGKAVEGATILAQLAQFQADLQALREEVRALREGQTAPTSARPPLVLLRDRLTEPRPAPHLGEGLVSRVASVVLVLVAVLLAGLPSVLVFQHLWLQNGQGIGLLLPLWNRWLAASRLALPAYFAAIFAASLALLALILLFGRRDVGLFRASAPLTPALSDELPVWQARLGVGLIVWACLAVGLMLTLPSLRREPGWLLVGTVGLYVVGWVLREAPLARLGEVWAERGEGWLLALGFHLAFILWLAQVTRSGTPGLPGLLLLVVAAVLVYRRRWLSSVYWITTAALLAHSLYLNAWWFSTIGDEGGFFGDARAILWTQSLSEIGAQFFNGSAVYGTHPYFSTLLQAGFMQMLGIDSFAWRFSSVYVAVISIPLVYSFVRPFVREPIALLTAVFMAASHYLMDFSRVGYNNTQALLALGLVLASAGWAMRSRRWLAYVVTGLSIALCFYVFPAGLYAAPLPFLFWLVMDPPRSRARLGRWAVTLLSALLLVFPLLFQPDYWKTKTYGTLFNNPELTRSLDQVVFHFGSNLVYAFFSPVYAPDASHYVVLGYLDGITAALAFIGLAYVLSQAVRHRFALFLVLSFLALLFLVGASHDRQFPSTTRMFMLLPWWTLFAAVAVFWAIERLRAAGLLGRAVPVLVGSVAIAVVALNLVQAYPLARERSVRYQSLEAVWLRTAQRLFTEHEGGQRTVVWINDPVSLHIPSLRWILGQYKLSASDQQVVEIQVKDSNLPANARLWLDNAQAMVVVSPRIQEGSRVALENVVRSTGRTACAVKNDGGQTEFVLWLPPESARLCPELST